MTNKMKSFGIAVKNASLKAAGVTAGVMVLGHAALAQTTPTATEAAITNATNSGMSTVSLVISGIIGIAALCTGLFIVLRLLGK